MPVMCKDCGERSAVTRQGLCLECAEARIKAHIANLQKASETLKKEERLSRLYPAS